MTNEKNLELVKKHIGEYPDFPKKGILFKDIFTAIRVGEVCRAIKELMVDHVKKNCPDVEIVAGLEARGFLFSLMIAAELGIGCVPIRKKGKLPGACESIEFELEYGSDVFEVQKDCIKPGQKILIVDDLLATGGSLQAAYKLLTKVGGIISEALVIMELTALGGRKKLECKVHSFIEYNDIE